MGTVHHLSASHQAVTLGHAAAAYLATLDHPESAGTRRVYASTLHALRAEFGRDSDVAGLRGDAVAGWFTGRWGQSAPATWNRNRDALRSFGRYCRDQGWTAGDLAESLSRRQRAPDHSRAVARDDLERLLARDDVGLRDKTLWRMLYETAARANEILGLDIGDLDLANRKAQVRRKGGAVDVIVWRTGTARLLPRLLKGRKSGPVFLTDRRARVQLPPGDLDPDSGRARLSYRQAAALFEHATGRMSSGPWTLHQLRHSALTHAAEEGASTSTLLAYSGHTSVASLARYARVSHDALGRRQVQRDPAWSAGDYDFVVVACRLPVDRVESPGGGAEWRPSPGGLVSALEPVMREADGAWVGWAGAAGDGPGSFDVSGMHLVGVGLSAEEVSDYYEGFCNATLWPLYHDVIAPPEFRRPWWDAYVRVNLRFARAAAEQAAVGATVWVNDYQLQLVPKMLREQRSDLRIGVFIHIPFPGYEIFAQLPWRRQIVAGLLGADLLGFQRDADATNFRRACRRATGLVTSGSLVRVPAEEHVPADQFAAERAAGTRRERPLPASRQVRTATFPISIDSAGFAEIASRMDVRQRANGFRQALGEPDVVLLGIDRLDYTKGILHRLTAYGELLSEGRFGSLRTALVLVASPSRERVEQYRLLREEVEGAVSRINGEHAELGSPPIHYLHQTYPAEEMAALYLAADVMLVTSLRDGMNLVAKEYVACRDNDSGALVLSEFTGAADELSGAFLVNPHDIEGMKDVIVRAATVPPAEARRRMRAMRRRVCEFDVSHWAASFLGALHRASEPS